MESNTEFLQQIFKDQAAVCEDLGSPFMGQLLRLFGERELASSAVADRLNNWNGDASHRGDVVPLRLAGALHALVLSNQNELLVSAYPPNRSSNDELWLAVTNAIHANESMILDWLDSAPQTNEVRRSAVIYAGLACIAEQSGLEMDLLEIGSSAGLNTWPTHFGYVLNGLKQGQTTSSVILEPEWRGESPPTVEPRVKSSQGCDLNPLNVLNADDRLRLLAYLWADQADRLERTRRAISIVETLDVQVSRMNAADWLEQKLATPMPERTRVIYHTVVWQYLDRQTREHAQSVIVGAALEASLSNPLAWLRFESDGSDLPGGAVTLSLWPQAETQVIARADFHGRWIEWTGWTS